MPSKPKAEPTPEPVRQDNLGQNAPEPQPVDPHAPDQPVVGEPEVGRDGSDGTGESRVNPNLPTYTTNPTPLDENGNPVT